MNNGINDEVKEWMNEHQQGEKLRKQVTTWVKTRQSTKERLLKVRFLLTRGSNSADLETNLIVKL